MKKKRGTYPGNENAEPRGKVKIFPWTILLPALTALVFGGLCLLSFVEIDWKGLTETDPAPTEEEISEEVLAKYRAESEKLKEIRKEKRADLTARSLLGFFAKREGDEEVTLPTRAALLADFQSLRARDTSEVSRVVRGLVPLWRAELEEEKPDERKLELIEGLFLQAVVSIEGDLQLASKERESVYGLAEALVEKEKGGLAAVALYMRRVAKRDDLPRLKELARGIEGRQLSLEITKIVEHLSAEKGA